MSSKYANRMDDIKASEIREILKVTESKDIISFAGGLPAPELFPVNEMMVVSRLVLEENGKEALQYTTTEGLNSLRNHIIKRMNLKYNLNLDIQSIQIVSGSQQALDMSGKLFLDKGDVVVCENPTYLGAINAFRTYDCQFAGIETDEEGIKIDALKRTLKSKESIKFIYVIPDFHNPTGRSWSLERRKAFMDVINQYDIPVIEDNPYGEITFRDRMMPSLKCFDTKGMVITLGTFSKIFCPGLRIGWITASKEFIEKYALIKQSMDLHTSNISQREISKYMDLYNLDEHIEEIKRVYKKRRDLAVKTMKEKLPSCMQFTIPEGGLFTWVVGPEFMDATKILDRCLSNGVAFVPGHSFYPNGGGRNTFRLNFSNATEEQLITGLTRLGKVLEEYFKTL